MKNHNIPLQTKVRVNEKAYKFMRDDVGITCTVIEHLYNALYDYLVLFDDGNVGKFKEEELDILEYEKESDSQ